jgi:small multidrug resistance pump
MWPAHVIIAIVLQTIGVVAAGVLVFLGFSNRSENWSEFICSWFGFSEQGLGWILLFLCVIFEVLAASCMKMQATTGQNIWYLAIFGGYFLCFAIFPQVLKRIPLTIAYAAWAGLGVACTAVIATVVFGEGMSQTKIISLCLIIAGIYGLNLEGGGH